MRKRIEKIKVEDVGFGYKGNGTTVWDRSRFINGDYKKIAHISEEGDINYYSDVSPEVKAKIEEKAKDPKWMHRN